MLLPKFHYDLFTCDFAEQQTMSSNNGAIGICNNRERANSKCLYYETVVKRPISMLLHMYDFLAYNMLLYNLG